MILACAHQHWMRRTLTLFGDGPPPKMKSTTYRLALFQFLTVVYCVLATSVMWKLRWGGATPSDFISNVRDYGFLLLLLPAAWMIWANWFANRPRVGTGPPLPILISGLLLLGFLFFLAFVWTAWAVSSIIQVAPSNS